MKIRAQFITLCGCTKFQDVEWPPLIARSFRVPIQGRIKHDLPIGPSTQWSFREFEPYDIEGTKENPLLICREVYKG